MWRGGEVCGRAIGLSIPELGGGGGGATSETMLRDEKKELPGRS